MRMQQNPGRNRLVKYSIWAVLAVCLFAFVGLLPSVEAKGNANPGVQPPQSHAFGKSYSEWQAAWWQWVVGIPTGQNPLLDETGEFADLGQSGKVWFLAGTMGGGPVERDVVVPKGKAIFFPVVNFGYFNFPTDPPLSEEDIAWLREYFTGLLDDAVLSCEIDGVAVQDIANYRAQSPLFDVVYPLDNIFGCEPGLGTPCFDEGYYLMLHPLRPGEHTIQFYGQIDDWFFLDVTYNITVR